MRARYLGDHDSVTLWGIHFPQGVYVPVSDAHAQKKVAGNNHFEVESSDAEDVEFVETAPPAFRAFDQKQVENYNRLAEVADKSGRKSKR